MELQFDRSVADSRAALVVTDPTSSECAFSRQPEGGKLLLPAESVPYSGGYYEQQMTNGVVEFQFKTNINVTTCNLRESFQARQFRIAVWTLNRTNALTGMRATSLAFSIKSTLHNDLKGSERWIESDGPGWTLSPARWTRSWWPPRIAASAGGNVIAGRTAQAARRGRR